MQQRAQQPDPHTGVQAVAGQGHLDVDGGGVLKVAAVLAAADHQGQSAEEHPASVGQAGADRARLVVPVTRGNGQTAPGWTGREERETSPREQWLIDARP